jgi:hypothetical protein
MALIQCADMIYKRAMKELKGDYEEKIGKTYDLIYNAINKKLENDLITLNQSQSTIYAI